MYTETKSFLTIFTANVTEALVKHCHGGVVCQKMFGRMWCVYVHVSRSGVQEKLLSQIRSMLASPVRSFHLQILHTIGVANRCLIETYKQVLLVSSGSKSFPSSYVGIRTSSQQFVRGPDNLLAKCSHGSQQCTPLQETEERSRIRQ